MTFRFSFSSACRLSAEQRRGVVAGQPEILWTQESESGVRSEGFLYHFCIILIINHVECQISYPEQSCHDQNVFQSIDKCFFIFCSLLIKNSLIIDLTWDSMYDKLFIERGTMCTVINGGR